MEDFSKNPCRHHLFEVFALDRSETDLRTVRAAVQAARDHLRFGKIVARDGAELRLSEADLNALEAELLSPIERLKAEQLIHQEHTFLRDPELSRCLESIAREEGDVLAELLAKVQGEALLAVVRATLSPLPSSPLPDDLPWPPAPEGQAVRHESLLDAVLREA